MSNPATIKDEAFSTLASATAEALVNLRDEKRTYTIIHLGINAAFADDTGIVFLGYDTGVPDGGTGLRKIPLKSGMMVVVGPSNGPIALKYKANSGAPLIGILAGELDVNTR